MGMIKAPLGCLISSCCIYQAERAIKCKADDEVILPSFLQLKALGLE